ncbi:citrate synthase [Amycolatopsis sp. NPDC088138]|uniref:citrate synthase n=1 Tax=Amycolatopsis sp. NPDC088138 TaxID=3363938 RepID=UPI0038032907
MAEQTFTTAQTARLLGVKAETVYAYVSRGLLSRTRAADGRTSLFDAGEVRRLAARNRRGAPESGPIETTLTVIRDGSLYYRGQDAAHLAGTTTFEAVTSLLWTGKLDDGATLVSSAPVRELACAVVRPLAGHARPVDLLPVIVGAAATADPLRYDVDPAIVVGTGRALLAVMVDALPSHLDTGPTEPLGVRLWAALTAREPDEDGVRALGAALVLLADHDLASSTMAVRTAASTRAHPYAVVATGLGALDGPAHGAAAETVRRFLRGAAELDDPMAAVVERVRDTGDVPGFGEPLYPDGDPRATRLLELVRTPGPVRSTVDDLVAARPGMRPNVDAALAVLAEAYDMVPGAGETIRAIGRTAGWLAHALEEYRERPNRFRPRGFYTGAP